jgi:nicotinamidase-related amidase
MNRLRTYALLLAILGICLPVAQAAQSCQTALLVIDMQMDLLGFGGDRLQTIFREPILGRVEAIVEGARTAGLLVIHVKTVSEAFMSNPDIIRIPASIAPTESEVVIARSDISVFGGTSLDALLKAEGISQLLVCGLYSTCCVDTAIRAGAELGYGIVVVADGHGDFEANLAQARISQTEWIAMPNVSVAKLADLNWTALCRP